MSEWISVDDKLPDSYKNDISNPVFSIVEESTVAQYGCFAFLMNEGWVWCDVDGRMLLNRAVTHWQELPVLPTDQDNGKWLSIKNHVPQAREHDAILVFHEISKEIKSIDTFVLVGEAYWDLEDEEKLEEYTFWLPYPEPLKVEESTNA